MPRKLKKTCKASGNWNKKVEDPASKRVLDLGLIFLIAGLSVFISCSGPSQQVLTPQGLSQMPTPNPNQDLQNQLMVQATQASQTAYKDYKVGAEDQLAIEIYGHDKLNRELRVNGQGEITMPLVGVVKVSGLTPQEIEKRLTELYDARFLVNPQITVGVKEYRHQRVAVTGAVDKPGSYEIIGPRTLLEVLSMAGGLSTKTGGPAGDVVNLIRQKNSPELGKAAKTGGVQPFTPKTDTMVIDLRRLVTGKDSQLNVTVRSGDVIHVPFAGTAYILGGVRRPGNIPVKENLTVSQAVANAGGIDPILGTSNITIMRFDDQGKPLRIETNLDSIIDRSNPDLPLKDHDVVVVKESGLKKTLYIIRTLLPIPSGSYSMAAY